MTTQSPHHGRDELALARIAAELAALGEPELDADASELDASAPDAAVTTLFALVHPRAADVTLDDLGRARAWRRIAAARARREAAAAVPVVHGPAKLLRAAWIVVAAAAAIILVPVLAPQARPRPDDADLEGLAAAGAQARSSLERLPGGQDRERAKQLAREYNARMHGGQP